MMMETKRCPECGGVMEKVTDEKIVERVINATGGTELKGRPVVYFGCTSCEHCEEK